MHAVIRVVLVAVGVSILQLHWPQLSQATSPGEQLHSALIELHDRVGHGPNSRRWREYLESERLEAELAKGDDADPDILAEILHQYNSGVNGLEEQPFVAVRDALSQWLDQIDVLGASQLPEMARRAKDHFVPVTQFELGLAKAQLVESLGRLDEYLASDEENGNAWKKYLQWEKLQDQLTADSGPDVRMLIDVYRRYTADHEGLELDQYAGVAQDLRRYIDAVSMAALPQPEERFAQEMEALANSLEAYAEMPSEEDNRRIGERLGWFDGTDQVPKLVRAVRRQFSHPNLYFRASSDLIDIGISRQVDQDDPVREMILGTRITGTAHTQGMVRARLIPSSDHAIVETVLTGTATSKTVGRNGPVRIYGDGQTQIQANKRMIIDQYGVRGLPASSHASTRTTIRNIATNGGCFSGLVSRIAWRRVGKQKSQAEAIAARRAERRVNRRVDREASELISEATANYTNQFRKPLLRQGQFPRRFHLSSSEDALRLEVLQADRFQLGAPEHPPEENDGHDLAARVHESLINNFAASLIAGRKFTEEQVQAKAIEFYGELPEKLKSDEDEDPWSFTFARSQPVTILFEDGGFKVTLRGSRFTSGERTFKAMNVSAAYQVQRTGNREKLVRQGDVEIVPPDFVPGKSRLSASQVALRRLLTKRLAKVFEPEIVFEGLELPGNFKKVGKLDLAELSFEAGWLIVGWTLPPKDATYASASE